MEAIFVIVGIASLVFIVVSAITYINLVALSKAELQRLESAVPGQENEWAQANEFEYVGSYRMLAGGTNAEIWVWRRMDRPTFFCRYLVRAGTMSQIAHDLVTEFADGISITTASTKDGNSIPHSPGAYSQSFSGTDFDERWQKHIEAENYLMDNGGARLEANDTPFEQAFVEAIRRQANYVRTLPLWPLRGTYWHFVRRYLLHNKSIQTQHEKGMIKLPNESAGEIPTIQV
ncbi:MAG: hypothetical protein PVG93_00170 [Phycisphaerales bacterium]|jgi:hypothetical protein